MELEHISQENLALPDHLLVGTAVRPKLLLPGTGPLVVLAHQVVCRMTVQLLPAASHPTPFEAALTDLQAALVQLADPPVDPAIQPLAHGPT